MDSIYPVPWRSPEFLGGQNQASLNFGAGFDVPANPFLTQWKDCSTHRLIRDFGGELLDAHAPVPKAASAAVEKLVHLTQPLVKNATDYGDLLGFEREKIDIGPTKHYKSTWHVLSQKEGLRDLVATARYNLGTPQFQKMSFKEYFQKVLLGDNLKGFTESFEEKKFFSGLFKLGWLGLGAIPVFQKTKDNYQTTQSATEATKTLGKEGSKALFAWELGTLGAFIGKFACPVGWAAVVTEALAMGLFSSLGHRLMDKLFP